jgi:hypothetical protein
VLRAFYYAVGLVLGTGAEFVEAAMAPGGAAFMACMLRARWKLLLRAVRAQVGFMRGVVVLLCEVHVRYAAAVCAARAACMKLGLLIGPQTGPFCN